VFLLIIFDNLVTTNSVPNSSFLSFPPDYSAFPSSYSAGLFGSFFLVISAGLNPAFICSCSTLSCVREFRERVVIAFNPSLSSARHLRWRVSFAFTSGGAPKYAYSGLNWPISQKNPQKFAYIKK